MANFIKPVPNVLLQIYHKLIHDRCRPIPNYKFVITLYAPKYGIGIHPRCVHKAFTTNTLVLPDTVNTTSELKL